MGNHVYKCIEVVGTSDTTIENAIQVAIERASSTIEEIRWFEVLETRGSVKESRVEHYQVSLKIGFKLKD
ncbi:MAG: dodecin [Verrucomicrobiota bacterium]